jgi:hypothetical protein
VVIALLICLFACLGLENCTLADWLAWRFVGICISCFLFAGDVGAYIGTCNTSDCDEFVD